MILCSFDCWVFLFEEIQCAADCAIEVVYENG